MSTSAAARHLRRRRGDRARGAQCGRLSHPCERDDVGGGVRARKRRGDRGHRLPRAGTRPAGLGVAMVNDGRMPAQTPYWESISVPGIYFAGNVTRLRPVCASTVRRAAPARERFSLQRPRPRAAHRREAFRDRGRAAAARRATRSSRSCSASLRARPSSGPEGLPRARRRRRDGGFRDDGIVPLADFVDRDGGDACAVSVEYDADGTIIPVVYVRRNGRLADTRCRRIRCTVSTPTSIAARSRRASSSALSPDVAHKPARQDECCDRRGEEVLEAPSAPAWEHVSQRHGGGPSEIKRKAGTSKTHSARSSQTQSGVRAVAVSLRPCVDMDPSCRKAAASSSP